MMKKMMICLGLSSFLLLGACSNNTDTAGTTKDTSEKQTQTQKKAEDVSIDKIVDGIKIKVNKPEIDEKILKNKIQNLYTFTISGENASSVAKGLGSIDFVLKTKDGKMVELDHTMAMFGDEIKPGKKIEGKVSFALDKNQTPAQLLYKPADKVLAEWDVAL
ncbi:DUF4352 domain-containing protein [Listeria booriae]|nr:DUF4352 domain-containing protein [Listeria booriae]